MCGNQDCVIGVEKSEIAIALLKVSDNLSIDNSVEPIDPRIKKILEKDIWEIV